MSLPNLARSCIAAQFGARRIGKERGSASADRRCLRSSRAIEQFWSCSRRRLRDEASLERGRRRSSGVAGRHGRGASAAEPIRCGEFSRTARDHVAARRALLFVGPRLAGSPAGRCGDQAVEPGIETRAGRDATRSAPDALGAAGSIPAASAGPEATATTRTGAASTEGGKTRPRSRGQAPGAGGRAGRLAAVGVSREPGGTLPW